MDVVYLYSKKYVQWNELLYSIRSVEKFYPDRGNIWIIGDKPEWIRGIKHIPHPSQQTSNQVKKTNNINERLFLAANHPEVSGDFVWMADDYCIVNPVTDSFIKKNIISRGNYNDASYRNTLEKYYKGSNHPYKRLLKQTLELTKKKGYSTWDYEAHCPFVFNKDKLLHTFKTFGKTRVIASTIYGNMHYLTPTIDTFRGINSKINIRFVYRSRRDPQTKKWAKDKMKNVYYINYNNTGLTAGLKKAIAELFPNKSKYEK